jgi:hypothetical protein
MIMFGMIIGSFAGGICLVCWGLMDFHWSRCLEVVLVEYLAYG